jgi:hypothetical protein
MKKVVILSTIIITVIIAGLLSFNRFALSHEIQFAIKQEGLTVDLFKLDDYKKIASLTTGSKTILLKNGEYYYTATGDKFGKNKNIIVVDNSTKSFDINIGYSSSYMNKLLADEQSEILAVIKNAYPKIINDYEVIKGSLFGDNGEWYGAVIKKKSIYRNSAIDSYRVILQKTNNKWLMVHYPEMVATKYNFPDVPINVLNSINKLDEYK